MFRRPDPKLTDLSGIAVLEGASPSELALAARLTTYVSFAPGDRICRAGEAGREAFLILSGEAAVRTGSDEIARLSAGAIAGELSILERSLRTADVIALSHLEAFVLSPRELDALLALLPAAAQRVSAIAEARLAELAA